MEQLLEMGLLISQSLTVVVLLLCVKILVQLQSILPSNPQPPKATSGEPSEVQTGVTHLTDEHDLKVEARVKEESTWK